MKCCLIIFFLAMVQTKEYELINLELLIEKIENENYTFLEQLPFNYAFVYKKGNKYIVAPSRGLNGVLYHKKERYLKDVINKSFPVDETPVNNYDKDRELIREFDFNKIIERFLNKGYIIKKDNYDYEDFILLTETIKTLKDQKKFTEDDYYELGFFMADCFRKKIKGGWKIEPVYTLNLYWIPRVLGEKNKSYGASFWKTPRENNKYLDLNRLMMSELANYKGIPVFSEEHAAFIKGKW